MAPETGEILYTLTVPWQTDVLPVRLPACPGPAFPVTVIVRAGLLPQALSAVTDRVPPVVPCVTVMVFVVDEPVQPDGSDQV